MDMNRSCLYKENCAKLKEQIRGSLFILVQLKNTCLATDQGKGWHVSFPALLLYFRSMR